METSLIAASSAGLFAGLGVGVLLGRYLFGFFQIDPGTMGVIHDDNEDVVGMFVSEQGLAYPRTIHAWHPVDLVLAPTNRRMSGVQSLDAVRYLVKAYDKTTYMPVTAGTPTLPPTNYHVHEVAQKVEVDGEPQIVVVGLRALRVVSTTNAGKPELYEEHWLVREQLFERLPGKAAILRRLPGTMTRNQVETRMMQIVEGDPTLIECYLDKYTPVA